jgi:cytochrome c biogenesis protein CcmG, thiol:disulfide interchange protein DsbE
MKRWVFVLPVLAFAVIAFFLFKSLVAPPPQILPSALIDKPAPRLTLPALDADTQGFGPQDLAAGHVTVVNVFASWCIPCHEEAPVLMNLAALSQPKGFQIFGMVQKDTPQNIRGFLGEAGNPFGRIALDADGRASIEWGVYGAPETFVVDGKGIIRFKYVGPLTDQIISSQLLPAIELARQAS